MAIRICLYAALLIFIQGCATYVGPGPDLTLTGKAAESEVEKFSFQDSFWGQGYLYQVGPERTWYAVPSVQPFVSRVSPEAGEKIGHAIQWHRASFAALGISLLSWIAAANNSDSRTRNALNTVGWIGWGSGLTMSLVTDVMLSSAAKEYNKDLRAKLTPTFGMNFEF